MHRFLHLLLFTVSGLEIVGTSLESLSLSTGQQHTLIALMAVYIPFSHQLFKRAIT